jgi:hypothetical protein
MSRRWFMLLKEVGEGSCDHIQFFIRTECENGSYCAHPERPGVVICNVKTKTRRREGWLRGASIGSVEVVVGAECDRLVSLMRLQDAWSWPQPMLAPLPPPPSVMVDNSTTHNTDNSTTNNHVFNLNVYLTETCSNAVNIEDFVDRVTASMTNIDYATNRSMWDYAESLAHMPYVDGVVKLLNDRLGEMDPTERPIQCTDLKRECFQIKHLGEWVKGSSDDPVGTPLRDSMYRLGQTRVGFAIQWKAMHGNDASKDGQRVSIMTNLVPGCAAGQTEISRRKIVGAVAKQTLIERPSI